MSDNYDYMLDRDKQTAEMVELNNIASDLFKIGSEDQSDEYKDVAGRYNEIVEKAGLSSLKLGWT